MKTKQHSPTEREALLLELLDQMLRDEISAGNLLRKLRREVLGMSQAQFASLVSVSRRTLSDIETDKGSQSLVLLNRVFRPFGLKIGPLPRNSQLMQQLMAKQVKDKA